MTDKREAFHIFNAFRVFSGKTLKYSLIANMAQMVVIILLGVTAVFLAAGRQSPPVPFAVYPDGKVIRAVALNGNVLSTTQLKNWFSEAMTVCLTLGPNDFRRNLERCRENFTDEGFKAWLEELKRSHVEERIVKGLNISELVPTGAVIIRESREYGGAKGYILEMPARMTFSLGKKYTQYDWVIEGLALRVDQAENHRGVAVEQVRIHSGGGRKS